MTLVQFLRIIAAKIRFIIIVPLFPSVIVILLTMNSAKEYKSGTLIFTGLASTADALGSGSERIDNYAVNNSFDNLLNLISSREILERTGLRLLALHLLQTEPVPGVIGEELFHRLQKTVDPEFRNRMTAGKNADSTFARLWREHTSPAVRLYTDNDKLPYCPEYIEGNLKMKRAGISDMIEMSYASFDAAATQQTLKILTGIFMSEYRSLKSQDAQNLVAFFTQEAETAEKKLNAITAELKEYRIANGIINYDEQTKQLTVEEMYMNGELREELRKYAASEASLSDLNRKLGSRSERIANNHTIVELREQLTKTSSELMTLESLDNRSPRVDVLRTQVSELKTQMRNALSRYSAMEHTEEGTSIELLEQQWIAQYIATVEGKVRIDVFKERRNEFRGRFNKFAPLGSSLHKYERDIDVAEKEYLELLHSLNMARLRQQNLEASTTIKVLDEPILPLKAEPEKRTLLLIGTFLISAFLSIVIVIALELLDRNIRTPERALMFTDLPVLAAYPDLGSVGTLPANQRAFTLIKHQLLRNFKLELMTTSNPSAPAVIAVASILNDEGKTTIASELAQLLSSQGNSVVILTPDNIGTDGETMIRYDIPRDFSGISDCQELIDFDAVSGKDFIIIELPSFQGNEIPVRLLRRSAMILFVMRADRIWRRSDSAVLKYITFPEGASIHGVVNGVHLDRIEEFVGELPTERSTFRTAIKRLAEFRFLTVRGKA